MRGKYRRVLLRISAVLTAFLVCFNSFPVYSQSSVDAGLRSCAADPVCRLSLARDLKELSTATNVVPISKNIGLKVLQGGAGTAPIAQTTTTVAPVVASGSSTAAKIVIGSIPVVGGALAAYFFNEPLIEEFKAKAQEQFCTSNYAAFACSAGFRANFWSPNNGRYIDWDIYPKNPPPGWNGVDPYIVSYRLNHRPSYYNEGGYYVHELDEIIRRDNGGIEGGVEILPSSLTETPFPAPQLPGMTQEQRNQIIESAPDSLIQETLNKMPFSNLIDSIPEGAKNLDLSGIPGYRLVPGTGGKYTLQPIGDPATLPVSSPASEPNPDPDSDGDGVPDSSDPAPNDSSIPGSNPNPNPSPTSPPSPSPSPTSPPEPSGEIPSSPSPATFSKPNFVQYAFEVFANKFPLDIMGTLPPGQGLNDCPKITFWQEDFELCIVRDFLKMLKIPVIISFIIWALLTL